MKIQATDLQIFKRKALQWASSFDVFCYLDSNNFSDPYSKFEVLLAVGAKYEVVANTGSAFDALERFRLKYPGWMTGFFSYDLKNEVENLSSSNIDQLRFPDLYFFIPEYLILFKGNEVEVISSNPQQALNEIESQKEYIANDHP